MSPAARWIIPALISVLTFASADAWAATSCSMSREEILASASGARRVAVERGFGWLDDDVPYSQTGSHDGYRTDCSGFVSMCWGLSASSNTSAFYSGSGNTRLDSYEDLEVADALVKRGHIVLFLGWDDADHEGACVLEQASTASDMQFRVRTRASLESSGYKPIRANNLRAAPGAGGDETQIMTQASEVGDPGDPDEDTSAQPNSKRTAGAEDDDDAPSNSRRRPGSALESGSCSASPHGASTTFPLWALAIVALFRRRRRAA